MGLSYSRNSLSHIIEIIESDSVVYFVDNTGTSRWPKETYSRNNMLLSVFVLCLVFPLQLLALQLTRG